MDSCLRMFLSCETIYIYTVLLLLMCCCFFFFSIGTLLHFDDYQLKMYYFLDPQWIAKLMAKAIQPNSPARDG